jgi:hypothetical protein
MAHHLSRDARLDTSGPRRRSCTEPALTLPTAQIFLLSPASCSGRRAGVLMKEGSALPLAARLRDGTLTLGEGFSFMSSLYFRGKLTYARTFGRTATPLGSSVLVITPTRGLQPPEMLLTTDLIQEFASVDLGSADDRYRVPLERDLVSLASSLPRDGRAILLGSVATAKYVDPLVEKLGGRLHYPPSFVGRGDMSRGGLLLRSAAARTELEYAVLEVDSPRRGARPPRLPKV